MRHRRDFAYETSCTVRLWTSFVRSRRASPRRLAKRLPNIFVIPLGTFGEAGTRADAALVELVPSLGSDLYV